MDAGIIITGTTAFIAFVAAGVAIWQALSASTSAAHAKEAADAAIRQASEAKRSADAAWEQIKFDNANRLHSAFNAYCSSVVAFAGHLRAVRSTTTEYVLYESWDVAGDTPSQLPANTILVGGLAEDSKLAILLEDVNNQAERCSLAALDIYFGYHNGRTPDEMHNRRVVLIQQVDQLVAELNMFRIEGRNYFKSVLKAEPLNR